MKKSILFFSIIFCIQFNNGLAQESYEIHFKNGVVTPERNIESIDLRSSIDESEVINGNYYRYIQFEKAPKVADIKALERQGIELLEYIPNLTYLASIPVAMSSKNLSDMNIRAIWKIETHDKLQKDVRNQSLPEWSIRGDKAVVLVKYFENLEFLDVANKLKSEKVEILAHNGVNNFIEVAVSLDKTHHLAGLPYISYVYPMSPPGEKEDRRGRSLHRVNKLNSSSNGLKNYNGEGISILVRDDGALFDHPDFQGRIDQTFSGVSRGDHGDGVGGIMAGAGNLNPLNRGMADGSLMYVNDYQANFLDETMSLFNNRDVIVTNSSYSNGCNAGYTSTTSIVDQQVYDNPTLLHVFSAGNSGRGILNDDDELVECGYGAGLFWANVTGGHKIGKNVIATANVNYAGIIEESSSRGPSRDGRIKPDIAANGHNHVSTGEGNEYMSFGGTSGAAPVVAGVAAMLHEVYEKQYGERAKSALLKAAMLNTANDLGNVGPDFIFGWGNLNAHKAVLVLEENRFINEEIEQDEVKTHTIPVPENVAELRIMTYWPDPEVAPFSGLTLLNDLNTMVSDAAGEVYMPWYLDPSPNAEILASPAIKGEDHLNNMEQVSIVNPSAGDYVLTISGDQVPFGINEYYVIWEYRMDEIDVIFPDGGENLEEVETEIIHWDAEGNEGEFKIELLDSDGNATELGRVPGHARLFEWNTVFGVRENLKIRVSRDGKVGESEAPFLLADTPRNLEIDYDSIPTLTWQGKEEAISYNIYALGEKYMEIKAIVEDEFFVLPEDSVFYNSWVSVSANFESGVEGLRPFAITTLAPPQLISLTNDQEERPCVLKPVIYDAEVIGDELTYSWEFGENAIPESADTKGPHTVYYTAKGNSLAALTMINDAGTAQDYFIMRIKDEPQDGEMEAIKVGGGVYDFETGIKFADDYIWDFGDGEMGEGKTVTHQFTSSGTFEVTLTASNKCGTLTDTKFITIDLTDVKELVLSDFIISPNPNNGNFNISLPDLEGNDIKVSLISIDGKVIDRKHLYNPSKGEVICWKNISSGVYMLNFKFDGRELTERIIVR